MIDQGIEFFNVEELLPVEGLPGRRLYRFPRQLCESLGESWQHNARFRSQRVHGCEMRFVTQARCFDVVLTAYEGDIDMMVFRGDRVLQKYTLPAGRTTSIHLEVPALEASIDPTLYPGACLAVAVWRKRIFTLSYVGHLRLAAEAAGTGRRAIHSLVGLWFVHHLRACNDPVHQRLYQPGGPAPGVGRIEQRAIRVLLL